MLPCSGPRVGRKAGAYDHVGNNIPEPEAVQLAAELVIVTEVICDGLESAEALEVGAAKCECRAKAEFGNAEKRRYQRARRKIGGDDERFPPAWPVGGFGAR